MATFTNTSAERQIWPRLVNAETGTTLELGPGESAAVKHWMTPSDDEGNATEPELVDLVDSAGIMFLEKATDADAAPEPPPSPVRNTPTPRTPPVDDQTASMLAARQDTTSTSNGQPTSDPE